MRKTNSKLIAIVGSIGSGKSAVGNFLKSQGFEVLDCDKIARSVANCASVIDQVRQLLGDQYILEGKLNRRAIRLKVFDDAQLLQQYNAIFVPEIKKSLTEEIQALVGVVFVEMNHSNFFDIGFDEIWEVASNRQLQLERVSARDSVATENILQMLNLPKARFSATHTIENIGSLQQLHQSIQVEIDRLKFLHLN